MARPRKDYVGPSATERILSAYWEIMEEKPFDKVTVAAVIRRSGVSPNTFYYHFESFQSLIQEALDQTLDPKLFNMLIAKPALLAEGVDPSLLERFHRVVLYATSGSGELVELLRRSLLEQWLNEVGTPMVELTEAQRQDLLFIFAGVVSFISTIPRNSQQMELTKQWEFFQRPLGQGVLATIEELRKGDAGRSNHSEEASLPPFILPSAWPS